MKSKIAIFLFALPFFGVGVWMGFSLTSNMFEAWQMRQWQPVAATLREAGYNSRSGDDSTTYEAYATFTYEYGGQQYSGDRIGITGGADNIGDYQQDIGNRLRGAMQRGERVTVYVNPAAPAMAVVDRSVRWAMVGFKSVFLLVFGGVGLGLIVFSVRSPKAADRSAQEHRDSPWLANEKWTTAKIKSSSKTTMYFAWGFAVFWNILSAPLPFVVYAEITDGNNWPAMLGLLFPAIGLGMIFFAVRRTQEWTRFGPAPVSLDPFPGSIGGHVGGTIDINLPYAAKNRFSFTLTSIRSYISGSGKNRSRRENAEWQNSQMARSTQGIKGSRLAFRFEVPPQLTESDAAPEEDTYYLWRLNLKADLDGVDINRDYEIPVYPTAERSSELSDFPVEQAKFEQERIDRNAIEKLIVLRFGVDGKSMYFPMARNLVPGTVGFFLGSIFAGIGWFLGFREGQALMGTIFGGIGALVMFGSLYSILNSLTVSLHNGYLVAVRRLLGITVRKSRMRRVDFLRFKKTVSSTTRSGSSLVARYALFAISKGGKNMLVGEGFQGASQADAAAAYIASTFNLTKYGKHELSENAR